MDRSMRMVLIGGMLMLTLLIAVIGSVSADSPAWHFAGNTTQLPESRSL